MELKTEGIVLKRYEKGEKDNVTVVFTRDMGKVLITSRSTRSAKSKLKIALELFSLNNYMLYKKNDEVKYYTLIQAEPKRVFEGIRSSLDLIGASYYILEITEKFMQLEQPNEELYDVLYDLMNGINDGKYSNVRDIINYYALKVLRFSGFNLTDDEDFFKKVEVSSGMKDFFITAEGAVSPEAVEQSDRYGESAMQMLDTYVSGILNEEVKSMKMVRRS